MDNNGYNGEYDPVFNNCLHYVNEILGYGNNINDAVDKHIHEFEGFSPNAYYNDLVRIIKQ